MISPARCCEQSPIVQIVDAAQAQVAVAPQALGRATQL